MANLYRVTCKAALFKPSRTKVLLVEYAKNNFGIPGGHLQEGEMPDDAIKRELREELNIGDELSLMRKDFWVHPNGKIVLGYTGVLKEETEFIIDHTELSAARWMSIEDIRHGKITAGTYDAFILQNSLAG